MWEHRTTPFVAASWISTCEWLYVEHTFRRLHMNTGGGAVATNDARLRRWPRADALHPAPQAGDILASERSARADVFVISVIPLDSDVVVTRYAAAIEHVRELARTQRVDGWYTCDHRHYARVADYRP
jgi:hypothetical protein